MTTGQWVADTSHMTSNRIRWVAGRYSGWSGMPGTSKIAMFTITWHTRRGDPAWLLRGELPGMTHLTAMNDDEKVLQAEAERWLDTFIKRISAAQAESEDAP